MREREDRRFPRLLVLKIKFNLRLNECLMKCSGASVKPRIIGREETISFSDSGRKMSKKMTSEA